MEHLWVIEVYDKGIWMSTIGAYLTREDARDQKRRRWERQCPNDKFRIRKYIREIVWSSCAFSGDAIRRGDEND